jgi:hypothetical protein
MTSNPDSQTEIPTVEAAFITGLCPECEEPHEVDADRISVVVTCDACETLFRVVR